jgi:hypothetical protein
MTISAWPWRVALNGTVFAVQGRVSAGASIVEAVHKG